MGKHYNSKNKYIYRAFGLNISSDICILELQKGEGVADINIICGIVPTELNEVVWSDEYIKVSKNELLLYVEGVAKYYVKDGKTIIVEPSEQCNDNSVKLYLLGTAIGTALLQKGIIPIHGSAVVIDGKCVIFTGISGAGKSTLSSAFRKMGYEFLADDVSVVTINEAGIPLVQPSYPQQKLWSDSLESMGEDHNRFSKIEDNEDKYVIPVKKGFLSSPVPLYAIFELNPYECSSVQIAQILGSEKLVTLLKNIYRVELLSSFGIKGDYFKKCLNVAKPTAFFKIIRPKEGFFLEEQIRLVREKLKYIV